MDVGVLNPQQAEAVKIVSGPVLVLAGAGSGKTRVLTHRIANLIDAHQVNPNSILALTYTNKAALEMKNRIGKLIGYDLSWVSTFHSIALRLLRRHASELDYKSNFTVYDSDDSKKVISRVLKTYNIDPKKNPPQQILRYIDQLKNRAVLPSKARENLDLYYPSFYPELYKGYQDELFRANAMDFTDLLLNLFVLLQNNLELKNRYQNIFKYVLVDEFQDTNQLQYGLLRELAGGHNNIMVVGDDDQSIYAFRGANPKSLTDFERDFVGAKIIKLEENYRSTKTILEASNSLISINSTRMQKRLWTRNLEGELIKTYIAESEHDEASFIADTILNLRNKGEVVSDIAVFYRTNSQSRAIEESLVYRNIPYQIFGGFKFFDRKEIKDIISYLRFILNPYDLQALIRIINSPSRGIGPKTLANLTEQLNNTGGNTHLAIEALSLQNRAINQFYGILKKFQLSVSSGVRIGKLIEIIANESGYLEELKSNSDAFSQSRIENISELIAAAKQAELPENHSAQEEYEIFLDRVSLMGSDENLDAPRNEESFPKVSLLTLHLAKGLEFDTVFFTGLEDGLLPHYLSNNIESGVEEERRLAYVGITRAKKSLYLTRSTSRMIFNGNEGSSYRMPSPFLQDIPEAIMQNGALFQGNSRSLDLKKFDLKSIQYKLSDSAIKNCNILNSSHLKTAQEIEHQPNGDFLKADLKQLLPGVVVKHPSFGVGEVKEVRFNESNQNQSVVEVLFFEKTAKTRRLVYSLANLGLVK